MSAGSRPFHSWRIAAGPPLIVLVVAGVRFFGHGGTEGSSGESLVPHTTRRVVPSASLSPVTPSSSEHPRLSGAVQESQNVGGAVPTAGTARHRTEDRYEVWDLSPEEFSWAAAHAEEVFGSMLEPASGGGVRLLTLGPYALSKGLCARDVILDIDGTSVFKPEDLGRLLRASVRSGSRGWRILVDRQGQEMTFDLRSLAGP